VCRAQRLQDRDHSTGHDLPYPTLKRRRVCNTPDSPSSPMILMSSGFLLEKNYFSRWGINQWGGVYKYIFANANFWRLWVKITTLKRKVLHLNFLRGNFFTLQDPFRPLVCQQSPSSSISQFTVCKLSISKVFEPTVS